MAESADAAVAALRRDQILVTRIDQSKAKAEPKPKAMKAKGVPAKNLAIFTRQFSVMIDAGLPLVQCLDILGKQEPHKHFSAAILKVREDVEAGAALADAMKKHPKTFDALYSNMIAAGEAGGILDTILKRLAVYIEKNVKLKGDVKSAMIYPIAVIVIAALVVGAILWKVIPTFATLFAGLGAQLPLPTRIVIAMSDGVVAWGWLVVLSIFAFGWVIARYYSTPGGRHAIDALLLKTPVLGNILRKVSVARFCRTLSTLLSSGVPILDGLDITARTSGNAIIEAAIQKTRSGIERGETVSGSAQGDERVPVDGRADDQRRRDDGRAGRDAVEDRGLLRGRSRLRRRGNVDAPRARDDRVPGRRRRRHRHRDVSADLRFDQQVEQLAEGYCRRAGASAPAVLTS